MSAAPIVIIINRPKKQHEKIGEHVEVHVLPVEGESDADLLRRAADQIEAEE